MRSDGDPGPMHLREHLPIASAELFQRALLYLDLGLKGFNDTIELGLGQPREQASHRGIGIPGNLGLGQ